MPDVIKTNEHHELVLINEKLKKSQSIKKCQKIYNGDIKSVAVMH